MQFPNLEKVKQQPDVAAALSNYSPKFTDCILTILHHEGAFRRDGGLNNHASDRGGLTKYGISQKAYPRLDIRNLDLTKAVRLYYRDYWEPMQCDHVPTGLALMLLDGAVQHGVDGMTRMVQGTVSAAIDGLFGSLTLKAVLGKMPSQLITGLLAERSRLYFGICQDDPTQRINLNGWFNRLAQVTERCFTTLASDYLSTLTSRAYGGPEHGHS
ncbi:hypothetical protein PRUB_a4059 [Pseudoalteromonas rubra]|uniref:Secretion activator protein n=1 Tax=Pseudoalteromonas rubra TaxID=43658 RepID=A0A8T0CAT6_9GAMM|nr:N-acetylmuramidase [Pseudoalteromonas rubra]KAF7787182.1 hypothetical protein PRUB_a4059 [Pseudoalteromonas rubra]